MRTTLLTAVLVAFAVPALADEQPAQEQERLNDLEHMVITAIKDDQPVAERMMELQRVTGTAKKDQPAAHEVDEDTAALLAEIESE